MSLKSNKNLIYVSEIKKIAKFINNNFYSEDEEEEENNEFLKAVESHEIEKSILNKSEKFYNFFSDSDKAIEFIRCLLILNPQKGKDFLESI